MWLLITIVPAQVYQLCSTEAMDANKASLGKVKTLWACVDWGRGQDAMFSEMDILSESHLPLM